MNENFRAASDINDSSLADFNKEHYSSINTSERGFAYNKSIRSKNSTISHQEHDQLLEL